GITVIRQTIPRSRAIVLQVIAVILVIAAYTWWSHERHLVNSTDRMVPSWSQMVEGFDRIIRMDEDDHVRWLVADTQATLTRLGIGLAVAIAASFLLGILMGCFRSVERFCLWWVSALAKIPATSIIAVIFVAVGTGMELYVAIIAFGVVPVLAESVFLLVRDDVADEEIHKAYTLGASHVETIWNVIVPKILPKFMNSVRLQIGPALVYLIAAEYFCAYIGFGYRINKLARQTRMDVVFPYLIALGVLMFIANLAMLKFSERAFRWSRSGGER
ncbi:MAG: ABC transporter permease subunit, partial [bacterium]|nr:ABC transporter permease subunit [bacterium]